MNDERLALAFKWHSAFFPHGTYIWFPSLFLITFRKCYTIWKL